MTKKYNSYEEAIKGLNEVDQSDFSQLSLARSDGWTVAHQLALFGKLFEKYITPEILKLYRHTDGWTVAHMLASIEDFPESFISLEILKLAKSSDGRTVAHVLANMGKLPEKFMVPEILLLDSDRGYVYEKTSRYKNLTLESVEYDLGLYLLAVTEYNYPKISYEKFKVLVDNHGLGKMKQMVKLTGKRDS